MRQNWSTSICDLYLRDDYETTATLIKPPIQMFSRSGCCTQKSTHWHCARGNAA